MGTVKGYVTSSEKGVHLALLKAFSEHGRPVTTREIIDIAEESGIEGQRTPAIAYDDIHREGGWTVFDFSDRVATFLRRLEKKGKARVWKEGGRIVAIPEIGCGYPD